MAPATFSGSAAAFNRRLPLIPYFAYDVRWVIGEVGTRQIRFDLVRGTENVPRSKRVRIGWLSRGHAWVRQAFILEPADILKRMPVSGLSFVRAQAGKVLGLFGWVCKL